MTKEKAEKLMVKIQNEMYSEISDYVFVSCRNMELTKDITQEVFYEVCRHIEQIAEHENYRGWVYEAAKRVIKRVTVNEIKIRVKQAPLDAATEEEMLTEDFYEFLVLDEFSHIVSKEELEILKQHYHYRRPISEIAEMFGKSEAACKMLLSRLRKEIRDYLDVEKNKNGENRCQKKMRN